jgi:hypothetical protein
MLKQIFTLLYKLIAEPTPTWESLSEKKQEKDNEEFYKDYLLLIFGIIAFLSFIGILFATSSFNVQLALKTVIKQMIVYGGSFYLLAVILSKFLFPRFGLEENKIIAERFVGYSSALIYIIAMICALFPSFIFLEILTLYSVYIIWVGATQFLNIEENRLIKFTIFVSILFFVIPSLLTWIVYLIMPGLKV